MRDVFIGRLLALGRVRVEQAIGRGEVPQSTDASEVIRAVSAPLYYRFLVSGDPLDLAAADRAVQAAAAAARAGAYTK